MVRRVMIVDDDEPFRQFLREFFEEERWQVLEARNGTEAFDQLANQGLEVQVGVVITDNCMPGMTGPALIDAMRQSERLQAIPVVLMTGDDSPHDKPLQLAKNWVSGFLLKPFRLREMMETVGRVIDGRTA